LGQRGAGGEPDRPQGDEESDSPNPRTFENAPKTQSIPKIIPNVIHGETSQFVRGSRHLITNLEGAITGKFSARQHLSDLGALGEATTLGEFKRVDL
jgi:hypothetical protein